MSFSMLSRNGRTSDTGKLTERLDIPVSEEMLELVIVAAAEKGIPKAEFSRDMLHQALVAPQTIGLSAPAALALRTLAGLLSLDEQEFAKRLLEAALVDEFDMIKRLAQERSPVPVDDARRNLG